MLAKKVVKFLAVVAGDFLRYFGDAKKLGLEDSLERLLAHFIIEQIAQFLKQHLAYPLVVELIEVETKFSNLFVVESVPKLKLVEVFCKYFSYLGRMHTA